MSEKKRFSLPDGARSLTSKVFSSNIKSNANESNSDILIIERKNLLCVFKLVIKDLLNSSLKHERILEKESFPLRHFFIVFEHILLHGYNGKKSIINTSANRKDLWPIIELITRESTDTQILDISTSTKEMTNIRTSLGRVRAWLRLALMQKHLADYFKILIEQKEELKDFYDQESLILSEESAIITGLLVGLNVLDFNFCLKETVLDQPVETSIDYSLYLRERRMLSSTTKNAHPPGAIQESIDELDDCSSLSSISSSPAVGTTVPSDNISSGECNEPDNSYEQRLANVLDQKHYVEEINRKLERTVTSLQERLNMLEQTNKSLTEDSAAKKTRVDQLEEQVGKLTAEKEQLISTYQRKIETLNADIEVERETYQKSRTGFDSIYNQLQKKYEDEHESKQRIESVYQTQMSQNNEFMESTKVMEQDIKNKTTLYDQMKEDHDRLVEQFRAEKAEHEKKEHQLQRMEKENQMLRQTINELETSIEQANKSKQALADRNEKLDSEKTSLETDLHVERECHQRLQNALNKEKEKVSTLQFDIHELNLTKQEYDAYKKETTTKQNDYERKFQEQDRTIEELALKLQASITREHEFIEKDGLRSSTWVRDEDVKDCYQCKKEFNTIRRKHHCRSCGQIFCESCVSTKLTLASSSKPVRVCDACCTRILAQCAVKSP
ncbi:unnamed protein product [Adineta ricciae]|uniref:RUN and FYVE domain-containing protein 2 n=1 Tax=Adineta ricciae TaxID=249248 RepID=A0A814SSS4_ADIRI|nr:unnamed protein product [Adineta ricciae]